MFLKLRLRLHHGIFSLIIGVHEGPGENFPFWILRGHGAGSSIARLCSGLCSGDDLSSASKLMLLTSGEFPSSFCKCYGHSTCRLSPDQGYLTVSWTTKYLLLLLYCAKAVPKYELRTDLFLPATGSLVKQLNYRALGWEFSSTAINTSVPSSRVSFDSSLDDIAKNQVLMGKSNPWWKYDCVAVKIKCEIWLDCWLWICTWESNNAFYFTDMHPRTGALF